MSIIRKVASFFGFKQSDKPQLVRPALKNITVRQARRSFWRSMGIPAAKNHRRRYYLYNPAYFGIQQNQMAKGIVRPAS